MKMNINQIKFRQRKILGLSGAEKVAEKVSNDEHGLNPKSR
jgi:hypothetical protein